VVANPSTGFLLREDCQGTNSGVLVQASSVTLHLTKSRYMTGLPCPRRLSLPVHQPPPYEEPAPGTLLDTGWEIGRKAHPLYRQSNPARSVETPTRARLWERCTAHKPTDRISSMPHLSQARAEGLEASRTRLYEQPRLLTDHRRRTVGVRLTHPRPT